MAEDPVTVVRRFVEECINGKNLGLVDELFAPNFIDHTVPPGIPADRSGRKLWLQTAFSAFPDLVSTIDDTFSDGEKVATRVTARGTHQGEFMGIAATGKSIQLSVFAIDRVVGGQIVEKWEMRDLHGLMMQLR